VILLHYKQIEHLSHRWGGRHDILRIFGTSTIPKIAFLIPPIANIGNFNTFIYKNAFSRPPIPKMGNFKTFIYINAFSRPQYQKMAFLIPLIQRNAFSRPLHTKNRDPHNVFTFFYPIQNNPSYKMVKICRPHI
jgi:hypothetical protein